ncbi:MFS transporter [Heyndrickxia acidicola]|uniref:MFS transporter n=1 Tax=Heyndrickxia acidicola TaxID=209389 RepID=A0ABU6MAG6_9BACI|nr:MFS transporter [Heyndrickxia acidicola]MED1201515.1 MFS transporter [Heyndrickxia acidicola]
MSQKINTSISETDRVAVPQFLVISFLTIFAIGPQYFSNLAYTMNQGIVQNGLNASSNYLLYPSILSNIAFALGVPFGPILTRKWGLKRNYLTFVLIFLIGSIINATTPDLQVLAIGRIIQGLSAGMLFLTILPVSLRSFPNKIRNVFLLMVISGLFGSSAVGAFFGSVSLSLDAWRWLYLLNIITSVLSLAVGSVALPKHDDHHQEHTPVDKTGVFILTLLMIVLSIPLCNLVEKGFTSLYVWPFFLMAFILVVVFILFDLKASTPIVPFSSLKAAKPISGTVMAVASHISLIFALAGINGFLRNNKDLPYEYLAHFYFWFFIGVLVTAVLKTLLFDILGAGILGMIGSLGVIYVSCNWIFITPAVTLDTLYFQVAVLGAGISMTLVSGALGTALAGDIHKASMRSVTLHSIRNFIGALMSPLLAWFITTENALHYGNIRSYLGQNDSETNAELVNLTKHFMENGLPATMAKNMASYELIANTKRAAILGAYHNLFAILLGIGVIMFLASIGKAVTGKGRTLVQKPKRMMLPAPKEQGSQETAN